MFQHEPLYQSITQHYNQSNIKALSPGLMNFYSVVVNAKNELYNASW